MHEQPVPSLTQSFSDQESVWGCCCGLENGKNGRVS